jgi:hypothetical protein
MDLGLSDQDIPVGSPIFSADDLRLGVVAGVDSGYVRVQADGPSVYWLPLHAIESVGLDRVTVAFPARQLEAYIEPSPPP